MLRHVSAIAANEIRIGIRNRWVLLATLILFTFALVLGVLGAAPTGAVKAARLTVTVASLTTLSVYLVPLIALLLSFDAIAGEIERGTLPLLLANPVSRGSVIFGKYLGHVVVVSIAVLAGYGSVGAGLLIFTGEGAAGLGPLALLIGSSILLGSVFIAIGYVASALVRQTGTAAACAIAIWLLAVILYDLGLLGALIADSEGVFAKTIFPYLLAANPADAFRLFNNMLLEAGNAGSGIAGAVSSLPFPPVAVLGVMALWILLALGATTAIFRRIEP